jgi:8-amino-7-oxononanoate synthase
MHKILANKLQQHRQAGLYRNRSTAKDAKQNFLSFSSNNYLGLADHPEVIAACKKGIDHYGIGSGASALLGGYSYAHHALEEELAEFLGYERVLLFSSGYMANLGTLTALYNTGDHIFMDRLNHASLVDGCRYSGARFERYQHKNIFALKTKLEKSKAQNKLICSDGLFSMDGDLAPLPELVTLAKQKKSLLMIDDAHGIGVLGYRGKGAIDYFSLAAKDIQILVGTLSKAFGTFGGFVASDKILIENLIQFARSYMYTTTLPPAIAEATRASLRLLQQEDWRRDHLALLIKRFQQGARQLNLRVLPSITPIQLIIIGETKQTEIIASKLKNLRVIVGLIRPPTVPNNTARLRISLTVNHTEEQINNLLETLKQVTEKK